MGWQRHFAIPGIFGLSAFESTLRALGLLGLRFAYLDSSCVAVFWGMRRVWGLDPSWNPQKELLLRVQICWSSETLESLYGSYVELPSVAPEDSLVLTPWSASMRSLDSLWHLVVDRNPKLDELVNSKGRLSRLPLTKFSYVLFHLPADVGHATPRFQVQSITFGTPK